jgi:hypothetical protein
LILTAFLGGMLGLGAEAQSVPNQPAASQTAAPAASPTQQGVPEGLPDAPGQPSVDPQSSGSIHGTVTDPSGDLLEGASVTLDSDAPKTQQTLVTDGTGSFNFIGLAPGTFRVTITSNGFEGWTGPEIVLQPGGNYELSHIVLRIATTHTDVEVTLTLHEVAEEQVKAEERQRILGVVPNFYVSYVWHAAPLSPKQKFGLALRSSIDPVTFLIDGATAGIEQSQDYLSGYGQGASGYAKRFGAAYADDFIATMIGGAILPSVFHQDPRYFYKGTGSIESRALHAISFVVICRGDNGHLQPNYSNVLGSLASAGISNLYYPTSDRDGAAVTVDNALIGIAEGAVSALLQEFIIKKFSRGVPPGTGGHP